MCTGIPKPMEQAFVSCSALVVRRGIWSKYLLLATATMCLSIQLRVMLLAHAVQANLVVIQVVELETCRKRGRLSCNQKMMMIWKHGLMKAENFKTNDRSRRI